MVCLQPGCVYHVQLKAEGNDHIERALPHHRVIVVRLEPLRGMALRWMAVRWECFPKQKRFSTPLAGCLSSVAGGAPGPN